MGKKCTAVMMNDKEWGCTFRQNNKQFYNYTLYMTVRFSINILLTTMSTILPILLMTYIMVIYRFWYSIDTIRITYKVYYEFSKNVYHIISTFLKEKPNDCSMLIDVKSQLCDDEYLEIPYIKEDTITPNWY